MKTAIYPGTFDPITYGHIDVIKKSLKIFDRVIVATTDNINKNYFFSIDERLSIIKNSLFKDLRFNKNCLNIFIQTYFSLEILLIISDANSSDIFSIAASEPFLSSLNLSSASFIS